MRLIKIMIIWIDLDEVLAETVEKLLEDNDNIIWNKKVQKEDIKDYYLFKIEELWLTSESAIELFRKVLAEDKEYRLQPVWAYKKLKSWKEKWNKLKVITARPGDLFKEYTLNWLYKYYPNVFDDVFFASDALIKFDNNWKDATKKSVICKNIWVDVMIEDNLEYAQDVVNCDIKTYLITKPWNKDFQETKNIIRVKSWDEIDI